MEQAIDKGHQFKLVDSHAHIDMPDFNRDRMLVVDRARERGVDWILCPLDLCSEESLKNGQKLQKEKGDRIFLAAGVHPHQAGQLTSEHLASLKKLAAEKKIVAVGEIGLDFHYNFSTPEKQVEAFKLQLELAAELKLPVIIHSRLAEKKLLELVPATGFSSRGILHCYTESLTTARKMVERGFLISFSGILTYPRAEDLRNVARQLPLDCLLIETDSPYLIPVPEKQVQRRNEPAFIVSTARRLAELHQISLEKLARITTDNFFSLFKLQK
ncbi:MAG: TatD family hydrolase [Candidatus Saccharicenans sp.]|uniref:TatD family hydrolase n=1 Tax=Candidatus Saccharicenans sp. TaxID=2819258 RepID=UPI00404AFE58